MNELKDRELKNTFGGVSIWAIIGAIAGLIFGVGVLDGQIKLKWQNHKNTEFKGNSEGKPLIRIRRKD